MENHWGSEDQFGVLKDNRTEMQLCMCKVRKIRNKENKRLAGHLDGILIFWVAEMGCL